MTQFLHKNLYNFIFLNKLKLCFFNSKLFLIAELLNTETFPIEPGFNGTSDVLVLFYGTNVIFVLY